MSTIKVNGIRGVGASTDAISVNNTDGTCTAKITNNLSNRNLIINGAMNIAQRGISSTANGYKTVDRWNTESGGHDELPTREQVAVTSGGAYDAGFRKALKITNGNQTSGAGTGDYMAILQPIEAQNLAQSGWNYVSTSSKITLSFWVKSSVAQNFYGYVASVDGTKQSYPFETGSLTANTWTKVTKTIPGASGIQIDNDNAAGFELQIYPFMGTDYTDAGVSLNAWAAYNSSQRMPNNTSTWWTTNDATFELTGVQLEVGDTATDFEHRSYGDELLRCQRYFQVWRDVVGLIMRVHSTTQCVTNMRLQIPMRNDAPTYAIGDSNQNFDLLYSGGLLASQNSSGWVFSAGGPRFGGFELMMTRGSGTFSTLDTVIHANIQFEYPSNSLAGIHHYFASADSEL